MDTWFSGQVFMNQTPLMTKSGLVKTFSTFSLFAIFFISSVSGYAFFNFLRSNLLNIDLLVTSEFIQSIVSVNKPSPYFEEGGSTNNTYSLDEYFSQVMSIPDVVRATVYNKHQMIIWSNDSSMIGKTFTDNIELIKALSGTAVYKTGSSEQARKQQHAFLPYYVSDFVESYIPIRDPGSTDQVVGVIELYKLPRSLFEALVNGRILVIIVSIFGGAMLYLILFWIVRRAGVTIDRQREELQAQVSQLSNLLDKNHQLQSRVQRASSRATEVNEHSLRRIGAELHDGPAQSIGFALLRLDDVATNMVDSETNDVDSEINLIRTALSDALHEIRSLSSGLAVPELEQMEIDMVIKHAVSRHLQRTHTHVTLDMGAMPVAVGMPIKICIYRMIQEGLNNSFRHAKGAGQKISVAYHNDLFTVTASDQGPGFNLDVFQSPDNDHLGLTGLRERVESLGGSFEIISHRNEGVRLVAVIPNNRA